MGTIRANRNYQQARWDEPFVMDMGNPGERGIVIGDVAEEARADITALIPEGMLRKTPPKLPELGQMQVLRHFLRLSQETIGTDINIDIGLGTCTMKYSPKINEQFVRSQKITELHPYQDPKTVQGILEILYKTTQYLKEISGLDAVSLQPSGGSQAIYSNVAVIRAYHAANGEAEQRNEIVTTMLSHPANPGAELFPLRVHIGLQELRDDLHKQNHADDAEGIGDGVACGNLVQQKIIPRSRFLSGGKPGSCGEGAAHQACRHGRIHPGEQGDENADDAAGDDNGGCQQNIGFCVLFQIVEKGGPGDKAHRSHKAGQTDILAQAHGGLDGCGGSCDEPHGMQQRILIEGEMPKCPAGGTASSPGGDIHSWGNGHNHGDGLLCISINLRAFFWQFCEEKILDIPTG